MPSAAAPITMAQAITAITAALGLPPVLTTTDPAVGNASASGTALAGGFEASRFATKQASTGQRERGEVKRARSLTSRSPASDQRIKHPPHLTLRFAHAGFEGGKIRGVAGARHHAQQIFACGFRIEFSGHAKPQDLGQVVVEPRTGAQHFGFGLAEHAKPRGVIEHLERADAQDLWPVGGVNELKVLRDEIDID